MVPAMDARTVHSRLGTSFSSVDEPLDEELQLVEEDTPTRSQAPRAASHKLGTSEPSNQYVTDFDVDAFYQCNGVRDVLWCVMKESWYAPLTLLPVLMWVAMFTCGDNLFKMVLGEERRPDVSTVAFPTIEGAIGMPHQLLAPKSDDDASIALDCIAAAAYTVHFVIPLIFVVAGWFAGHIKGPSFPLKYLLCLGILNVAVVMVQMIFPVAPPWHYEKYGPGPHSREFLFTTKGEAAGLGRVDDYFGNSHFYDLYVNAPIVFGSFPSLHAAWPILCAMFHNALGNTYATIYWTLHSFIICWAALYLQHHFLIDVLGGALFSWAAVKFGLMFYDWYSSSRERRPSSKISGFLG